MRDQFRKASDLIKAKRYEDARSLLQTIDHPKSREWLIKLDQRIPPAEPKVDGSRFFCEYCGKEAGPEMFTCSRRAAEQCPYHFAVRALLPIGITLLFPGLIFLLVGLGLTTDLFATLAEDIDTPSPEQPFFGIVFTLIGALLIFGAIYTQLVRRTVLINPRKFFQWERQTLFGWEVYRSVTAGVVPLNFEPPAHPEVASIGALFATKSRKEESERAAELFLHTLVNMAATNTIEMARARRYKSRFGSPLGDYTGKDQYLVRGTGRATASGALETRILDTVTTWYADEQYLATSNTGLTPYELVRSMYQRDAAAPAATMIYWVEEDAAARGLGAFKRQVVFKQFQFDKAQALHLKQESEAAQLVFTKFFMEFPKLEAIFRNEIQQGIKSREIADDDD